VPAGPIQSPTRYSSRAWTYSFLRLVRGANASLAVLRFQLAALKHFFLVAGVRAAWGPNDFGPAGSLPSISPGSSASGGDATIEARAKTPRWLARRLRRGSQ